MALPLFIFTSYKNFFKVEIPNLATLSVAQIQEIEAFVKIRKGIFDFETYSFVIQKSLTFDEFVNLLKNSTLSGKVKNRVIIEKEQPRVSFGQYKGMLYRDIEDSYLLWLAKNYTGSDTLFIKDEILRRKL